MDERVQSAEELNAQFEKIIDGCGSISFEAEGGVGLIKATDDHLYVLAENGHWFEIRQEGDRFVKVKLEYKPEL